VYTRLLLPSTVVQILHQNGLSALKSHCDDNTEQWSPTPSTRIPRGTRRHLRGHVKIYYGVRIIEEQILDKQ
jgi:hypothetical protein